MVVVVVVVVADGDKTMRNRKPYVDVHAPLHSAVVHAVHEL
jgi:hypothetical protein